ncbi:uncharacterized protein LACBIDRAFT_332183 [Laccaria bicolor S238N-H82]|uniref:Predicted protein n=1 Tax=Laccaria bicolor (strain S238N-H82 / ATCC MYA-4686) TaxID=486041 RepID=B0DRV3_LACBS|nr:uncharacterized protein LACBIDRAFT_332183 [Laccaria bicolor S238N-H82]EDR02592.1 predicted protein [Laccaria bicolor S238N-H82]|eukprot:XP_001886636.1 predicted protein [Laccaria bicolor S238N-H82]
MAAPATYTGIAISNCVQLIGTIITWFLSGSLLVQCYDFFCTDHLNGDLKFIKVAGVHHRDFPCPAFMYQILVWVRSMAVTAGAWQSLIVAWGNPTIFTGPSVFPVFTVPLTGIGESSTQPILQRTDFAIDRILRCSDFFCLVALMQLAAAFARGVAHTLDLSAELVQAKLESSFKSTKRIIDRLIIVTLETAAVTLITTLVQLILYSRSPTNSLNRVGIMYILGGFKVLRRLCHPYSRKPQAAK